MLIYFVVVIGALHGCVGVVWMPIKYTLTKNDILAEDIHDCAVKSSNPDPKRPPDEDEELLKTKATIIASFASSQSWQTSKALGGCVHTMGNPEVKNAIKEEHDLAKASRWKQVRSADIQEVASMNIGESAFSMWLLAGVDKKDHVHYKKAWGSLLKEFAQECDDISGGKQ